MTPAPLLRLHLGCGAVALPGFTNIDQRYQPGVDEIDNVALLRRYEPGTVALIYSCHVLDHFSRWEYKHVLARWAALLRPGGLLRIATPDFEAVARYYALHCDVRDLTGMLYAGQDYPGNVRHFIFDLQMLSEDLVSVGLENVHRYDALATDYAMIDDCSQAFMPRGDKRQGALMSLNVEAFKPEG